MLPFHILCLLLIGWVGNKKKLLPMIFFRRRRSIYIFRRLLARRKNLAFSKPSTCSIFVRRFRRGSYFSSFSVEKVNIVFRRIFYWKPKSEKQKISTKKKEFNQKTTIGSFRKINCFLDVTSRRKCSTKNIDMLGVGKIVESLARLRIRNVCTCLKTCFLSF